MYLLLFLSRPDAFDVKLGTITSWIGDHLVITLRAGRGGGRADPDLRAADPDPAARAVGAARPGRRDPAHAAPLPRSRRHLPGALVRLPDRRQRNVHGGLRHPGDGPQHLHRDRRGVDRVGGGRGAGRHRRDHVRAAGRVGRRGDAVSDHVVLGRPAGRLHAGEHRARAGADEQGVRLGRDPVGDAPAEEDQGRVDRAGCRGAGRAARRAAANPPRISRRLRRRGASRRRRRRSRSWSPAGWPAARDRCRPSAPCR